MTTADLLNVIAGAVTGIVLWFAGARLLRPWLARRTTPERTETRSTVTIAGRPVEMLHVKVGPPRVLWRRFQRWRDDRRARRYVFRKGSPDRCLVGMEPFPIKMRVETDDGPIDEDAASALFRASERQRVAFLTEKLPPPPSFASVLERELAAAQAKADHEDALMAQAAAGGPFWGEGKPAGGAAVGLGAFIPDAPPAGDRARRRRVAEILAMAAPLRAWYDVTLAELSPFTWTVGERAVWFGDGLRPPAGATSNPPAPSWTPPSADEQARVDAIARRLLVTVRALNANGYPVLVETDDGFSFDPSIDPDTLVPIGGAP